jgi:uracil-DNA glycosylase
LPDKSSISLFPLTENKEKGKFNDVFLSIRRREEEMIEHLEESWRSELKEEFNKPYMKKLEHFLQAEKMRKAKVFPQEELIFNAFSKTPFSKTKVVIIGQDPYHGEGQAHGLSFSVPEGVEPPPSLKNIFLEMKSDIGLTDKKSGCLDSYAKQGVLLLNATLTVRKGEPKSHFGMGWEEFTDAVIDRLIKRTDPLIFVLWGKVAMEKCQRILAGSQTKHAILTAAHPSPFSAHQGFFGCHHFSKINSYLLRWGKEPISW